MNEIIEAIKRSAIKIKDAIIDTDTGKTTNTNSTGDTQLKLDVLSDIIIEEEFAKVQSVKELISEEKEQIKQNSQSGEFIVGYDPLDGSSLVDVNLSVGSIFGIYKGGVDGKDIVASVYVVYGPRVEMVVCQDVPKLYRLNSKNEFVFVGDIRLNQKGKLNASGGTQKGWSAYHKKMIDSLFNEGYRLRYSGGMVPDLHQILLKGGGLFSYPSTADTPKGKLRMVFEVFPFAYIYERAGGASTNGTTRTLELKPSFIHDTTPCFFGSNDEIELVKKVYANNG